MMFQKNKLLLAVFTASLTAGLTACGGGSSSDSTATPVTEEGSETGRFLDSAVGGLEYETSAGYQSITNANGEFRYNSGETVSFRLGTLNFGSVTGQSIVTPRDVTENTEQAARIAQVLQTLDDDGIPDNGITITSTAREAAANQNPVDVFNADLSGTFAEVILDLASANTVRPTALVTAEAALEHLESTMTFETKATGCGDLTTSVTERHLAGKTFGFIRHEADDKEIALFKFGSDNTLRVTQNDLGEIKDRNFTWSVADSTVTQIPTDGSETLSFNVCAADGFLIAEKEAETTNFYEVTPFSTASLPQSYMLSTFSWDLHVFDYDILSISGSGSEDLEANFLSMREATTATIASTGELELGRDSGVSALYLLAAQGKRIGIYADYAADGTLNNMSTANIIAEAKPVVTATFSGKTFVDRNEENNETIILIYREDGTAFDYHNDRYEGNRQVTGVYTSTWSVTDGGFLEQVEEGETERFRVFDSGLALYVEMEERNTLETVSKTQAITSAGFLGSYNVNIPTEPTKDRLVNISNDGSCTYASVNCSWTIKNGKAVLSFGDSNVDAEIWQLAGTDTFALLMVHHQDDIEVGFMTRK